MESQKGDLVVLFTGVNGPYLLRPVKREDKSNPERYEFIGECYRGLFIGILMQAKARSKPLFRYITSLCQHSFLDG